MNRPQIKYFITADQAHLDPKTQKVVAKGFFDRFRISLFPAKAPQFYLVLGVTNIRESVDLILQIHQPNGQLHTAIENRFQANNPLDTNNRIFKMDGLPLPERGIYTVKIIMKEDQSLLGEYMFIADFPPKREFTQEEITKILNDPGLIKDSKVKVECNKCGKKYHFALSLDPNQVPTPGFMPFPENNKLDCCGELDLTGLRREIEWTYGKKVKKETPPVTPNHKPKLLN